MIKGRRKRRRTRTRTRRMRKKRGQGGTERVSGEGEKGEEIWKKAVLNWKQKTYLEKQDIDAILCFGYSMGYLDITQQKASICLLLQYIEMTLAQLQQKKKQQQKLYSSMGILGGMLIIVILL